MYSIPLLQAYIPKIRIFEIPKNWTTLPKKASSVFPNSILASSNIALTLTSDKKRRHIEFYPCFFANIFVRKMFYVIILLLWSVSKMYYLILFAWTHEKICLLLQTRCFIKKTSIFKISEGHNLP